MAQNGEDIAAQYDLLPKMLPYLDRHLAYPLIDQMPPSQEVQKLKYELFKGTNMVDYIASLYQELNNTENTPADFQKKKEEVLKRREQFDEETSKLRGLLEDQEVVSNLRSDKVANLNYLRDTHGVSIEMVNALYEFGQLEFSCGDYGHAFDLLFQFRLLSTDSDKVASATWGRLCAAILTTDWESAMEEIQKVKESIDTRLFNNPLAQLQQRTWLIHWCLYPFFNHEQARDTLTELYFSPAYINTIQTTCPWILRFLTVAVITNRKKNQSSNPHQKQLKDLIRIVKQEGYEYSDPITDFIRALYIDFDFEEAQKRLAQSEDILRDDFFLGGQCEAFVEAARHLISESYCKIHQRIDINDLSTRLGLSQEEGEKWIVNLIRDTRVDAKINYQEGTVVMNHPPQSVYQQVIERTKGGFFRTQVLNSAVAK